MKILENFVDEDNIRQVLVLMSDWEFRILVGSPSAKAQPGDTVHNQHDQIFGALYTATARLKDLVSELETNVKPGA